MLNAMNADSITSQPLTYADNEALPTFCPPHAASATRWAAID